MLACHCIGILEKDRTLYPTLIEISFIPFNMLWRKQNGRHFAVSILKSIFLNDIFLQILTDVVPEGPVSICTGNDLGLNILQAII